MRALESDSLPSIILAVTAYCTAEDRQLCLDAGMDAFVGKPLTPEKLRKVLLAAGRRMLAAATIDAVPQAPAAEFDTTLLSYISDAAEGGLNAEVERFLTSLDECRDDLVRMAESHDLPQLHEAAHRVLAQARMVGAAALVTAATALQQAAKAGDRLRCEELQPAVLQEIRRLTAALRHRRSGALTS